jgi:hypothetical protein
MPWRVKTYKGAEKTDEAVLRGQLSETEVRALLQKLVARHLDEDEIRSASQRKGTDFKRSDFEIHRDGKRLYTNGTDVHYVAEFFDE